MMHRMINVSKPDSERAN